MNTTPSPVTKRLAWLSGLVLAGGLVLSGCAAATTAEPTISASSSAATSTAASTDAGSTAETIADTSAAAAAFLATLSDEQKKAVS